MISMIRLALTEAETRDLLQLKRDGRTHEERWRAGIILDAAKGMTEAQLAAHNDCSLSGVEKTLARFRGGGIQALLSARCKPHKRKLEPTGMDLMAEAIRQSPRSLCPDDPHYDRSLWTLQLMADYIAAHTGVHLGLETVRRYLRQLGWCTKSPKLSCTSPDPEYATKMVVIEGLRERAEKGGLRRRWSSTAMKLS
jgi:transposase